MLWRIYWYSGSMFSFSWIQNILISPEDVRSTWITWDHSRTLNQILLAVFSTLQILEASFLQRYLLFPGICSVDTNSARSRWIKACCWSSRTVVSRISQILGKWYSFTLLFPSKSVNVKALNFIRASKLNPIRPGVFKERESLGGDFCPSLFSPLFLNLG